MSLYQLFQNQSPHVLLSSLFWKLSQPLIQDPQNSKQTHCRLPIIVFLWTSKGFISPESFLNFLLNLYIPSWLLKSFTFNSVKITADTFGTQKIESVQFFSCLQAKLSPRFLSLFPRQMGIAHSSGTTFSEDIFSWAERGAEGLWSWKNYQN